MVTSGYMGSSLEKRTDKMLQALKGPKAWDRRRSNYPHLAGQISLNCALASHTCITIDQHLQVFPKKCRS